MRPTLAKGHSVSDSTSWAYALLVVLLAAPVLAAVVVLVTMVGQSETNRVPVQASGSGGQSVAQDVRPVIVMQRVSRASARRPGSAADPVGRQVTSPATLHERIDRFTSRRREPTRRRRGDSPAGDTDPVPYPSSSWPAVAPPLIETPGVTRPDSHASGDLGRDASTPRSWGQWVRALVELTIPPRQVRPPVGARQVAVRAIVAETPEIPARAEGGYVLPPVRVRAGLAGIDGSPRLPLMVSAIAEIEAGPDVSRHDGAGPMPSKAEIVAPDVDGFELGLIPAVIDQSTQIQMSFLLAEPDSGDGFVISEPSLHDLTRLAPVSEVAASIEWDVAQDVESTGFEAEPVADGPDIVIAVPSELVLGAPVVAFELVEVEPANAVPAPDLAFEPVMADVEIALVSEDDLVEVDTTVAMPEPVLEIEPVLADVKIALVAVGDPVQVEPDVGIAEPEMAIEPVTAYVVEIPIDVVEVVVAETNVAMALTDMTISPVMADVDEALLSEGDPVQVELVYAVPMPVMAKAPVMADFEEAPVVASELVEVEPVNAMPAPVMANEPVMADVEEALLAKGGPVQVELVYAMPMPVVANDPVMAEVDEAPVVASELVEVEPVNAMPAPVMANEPVMADVEEALLSEGDPVQVELVYAMPMPVMANDPVMAEVEEAPVVASGLVEVEPVHAMPAPVMAIEPVTVDVEDALVAQADPFEMEPGVAIPEPEMAIRPVTTYLVEIPMDVVEVVVAETNVAMALPDMAISPIMADVGEAPAVDSASEEEEPVYATPVQVLPVEPVVAEVAEVSASDQEIGEDHVALGFENQHVVDAWAAMTQIETVDVATPSVEGLELEPFVDVPVAALASEVDGIGTEALVKPAEDVSPVATGPADQSGSEQSHMGTGVLGTGQSAIDEPDLAINGLDCDEEVGPAMAEATFTLPPAPPVEEPQPAWMPLPRSPKFRWVRVAMQATEVTVPRDVFAGQ